MKDKLLRAIILVCTLIFALGTLVACSEFTSNSYTVNHNLNVQANNFECERRITVYNARTDKIILEAEGLMNITNNAHGELVCTVKTAEDTYKKHLIYLNEYTLYVVEDITGTRTDPYHYKIYFNTVVPDVEINPGK